MNVSDVDDILTQYIKEHLSPTNQERQVISQRYLELQEFLGGRSFQNGSYARFTSTTPVNDLDVIYELPEDVRESLRVAEAKIDPDRLDIHQIIETLASELEEFYGDSAGIERQPHSVGIYFGTKDEFSIDVVPAVQSSDGMYWVPKAATMSITKRRELYRQHVLTESMPGWIKSDPKGYIEQASTVDRKSDGRFRKVAKAVKKWKWSSKKSDERFALKSFHLELAVTRLFQGGEKDLTCSEALKRVVALVPSLIERPQFPDRADAARYVDDYIRTLSTEERQVIDVAKGQFENLWGQIEESKSRERVEGLLSVLFGGSSASRVAAPGPPKELRRIGLTPASGREVGEQFLEDFGIPINLCHKVHINAWVTQDGFRKFRLLGAEQPLLKRLGLDFFIENCTVPEPFDVKWKIKNTGEEAQGKNALRGEIIDDLGRLTRHERTLYLGEHYVHCYIIKDGVCVAMDHIDVPIGRGWSR